MASFTISQPGSNEDANEVRRRLGELGGALGYGARRGRFVGRGGMGLLLRDLADGGATVIPVQERSDLVWLDGVFEGLLMEHPERAEVLQAGMVACRESLKLFDLGPVGGSDGGRGGDSAEG